MNRITFSLEFGILKVMIFSKIFILRFMKPSESSVCNCYYPEGIKFLQAFVLALVICTLRTLNNFQNLLKPLCTCSLHEKLVSYFLLHCSSFATERSAFQSKIREVNSNLLNCTDSA